MQVFKLGLFCRLCETIEGRTCVHRGMQRQAEAGKNSGNPTPSNFIKAPYNPPTALKFTFLIVDTLCKLWKSNDLDNAVQRTVLLSYQDAFYLSNANFRYFDFFDQNVLMFSLLFSNQA